MKKNIKEQLSICGIYELRNIARFLGIKKTGFKMRYELIEEIGNIENRDEVNKALHWNECIVTAGTEGISKKSMDI